MDKSLHYGYRDGLRSDFLSTRMRTRRPDLRIHGRQPKFESLSLFATTTNESLCFHVLSRVRKTCCNKNLKITLSHAIYLIYVRVAKIKDWCFVLLMSHQQSGGHSMIFQKFQYMITVTSKLLDQMGALFCIRHYLHTWK